jgi:hypothetical protein
MFQIYSEQHYTAWLAPGRLSRRAVPDAGPPLPAVAAARQRLSGPSPARSQPSQRHTPLGNNTSVRGK